MLLQGMVVVSDEAEGVLALYLFELGVVVEEVVVGAVDPVDVLVEEVLCDCDLVEERGGGQVEGGLGDNPHLLAPQEGKQSLVDVEVAAVDEAVEEEVDGPFASLLLLHQT